MTTAPPCPTCGGPVESGRRCDFDRPPDDSPALGDYAAMHEGRMTHAQHVLIVARWMLHNASSHPCAVLAHFRPVADAAWGQAQPLFPLRD